MLTFDFLRVKNATYGGTPEDLEWALASHAALVSQGMINSRAQFQVCRELKARIEQNAREESAENWAKKYCSSFRPSKVIGVHNFWQDVAGNYFSYTCCTFLVLGVLLLLKGEDTSPQIIFLSLLVGAVCLLVQGFWQMMLGRLRLIPAVLILMVLLIATVVGIGVFATTFDFSVPDGGALPAWIMLVFGVMSGAVALFLISLIGRGALRAWHQPMSDAKWEHTVRAYARQKLLMNEAYLDQHINAAKQAAQAERRPLVVMCGNPISYLKTAPKDPTYKPWMDLLWSSFLSLALLVIGTVLLFINEPKWWLTYLLAALAATSAVSSYRDYKRKRSR